MTKDIRLCHYGYLIGLINNKFAIVPSGEEALAELHRRINEGREIERYFANDEGMTTAFDCEASDREMERIVFARMAGREEARSAIVAALDHSGAHVAAGIVQKAFVGLQAPPSDASREKAFDALSMTFELLTDAVAFAFDREESKVKIEPEPEKLSPFFGVEKLFSRITGIR